MNKKWNAPIYAFFGTVLKIEYIKRRKCHTFVCSAVSCRHEVCCFIGTSDAQSTGNMHKHIKKCWGEEVLSRADDIKNADKAHEQLGGVGHKSRSTTAAIEKSGKGAHKTALVAMAVRMLTMWMDLLMRLKECWRVSCKTW